MRNRCLTVLPTHTKGIASSRIVPKGTVITWDVYIASIDVNLAIGVDTYVYVHRN